MRDLPTLPEPFAPDQAAAFARVAHAHGVPGLALVVRAGGRTRLLCLGHDAADAVRPVTPDTWFSVASTGKHVTATAVLALAQQGAVDLAAPVERYLADLPAAWRGRSVFSLLHHTSGLPEYLAHATDAVPDTRAGFMALYGHLQPVFGEGEGWAYTNTNYILLGMLVARLGGAPYAEVLHALFDRHRCDGATVAGPAWVRAANAASTARAANATRAAGAASAAEAARPADAGARAGPGAVAGAGNGAGQRDATDATDAAAAGAPARARDAASAAREVIGDGDIAFTARGAARWLELLLGTELLPPPLRDAAFAPAPLVTGRPALYGCGWFVDAVDGHALVHHGGHFDGFTATACLAPQLGAGVLAMCNLAPGNTRAVRQIALAALEATAPGSTPLALPVLHDTAPDLTASARRALLRSDGRLPEPALLADELRPVAGSARGVLNLWAGSEPLGFELVQHDEHASHRYRRFRLRYADRIEHVGVGFAPDGRICWAWPL